MLRNLQRLPVWQRSVIFFSILIGFILGLIGLTLLLIGESFAAAPRQQGQALVPEVTVRQFAALPDDDAYPPALAVGPDGAVYTGSFATGAMWRIEPDGTVGPELPGTRETIGAFMGAVVASDGTLIVIDQGDTDPRTIGGALWRVDPVSGTVTPFTTFTPEDGWAAPNDITIDAQGRVYVSDAGRNQIYRFETDGSGGTVWWVAPVITGEPRVAITGLTYDPT
ncbi:MAG: hypothetical protein NZM00_09830, partial [Anaerolinea sp.]|nr:hypothetical protein [Anaerolinea sp.]